MAAIAILLLVLAQGMPLERLIQTERDFSHTSELKGIKDSFLAYIADDGIIFRPGPVPGKKWISERPASPGLLTWRPVCADISRAGDLGYTTGPYEFRNGQTTRFGNYFTVWKLQPDGTFKFVIDFGTSNPQPSKPPAEQFPAAPGYRERRGDPVAMDRTKEELLRLDREFSSKVADRGIVRVFGEMAAEEIRVLRSGHLPALGKTAMRSLLSDNPGVISWSPEKADVAASADLGYTYGGVSIRVEEPTKPKSGYYVRVWKKQDDGRWRIVLDDSIAAQFVVQSPGTDS